MKTIPKNNPIATVIKNYINKKSGKVSVSRDEIQRRFFGLDWKDQKKILAAFLNSGQADRIWAYSKLLDIWDTSFEPKVLELWEAYHEEKCAWVIIRHFPEAVIKEHVNTFNEDRDYYFICRRLAADPDFVIDKDRLSNTDYLMALSHGNRHIDDDEAYEILYTIVQEICFQWAPTMELSRSYYPSRTEMTVASDFKNVSIALYYLEKMGCEDVVTAFRIWESQVRISASHSDEYEVLNKEPLSDYKYKERVVSIAQKYLYFALPPRYKTMTDEEYSDKQSGNGFKYHDSSVMSQEAWVEAFFTSLEAPF